MQSMQHNIKHQVKKVKEMTAKRDDIRG
jgi:hypothetical protein